MTDLLKDVRDEVARRQRLLRVESRVARELEYHGMLGRSAAMQEVFSLIRRLAPARPHRADHGRDRNGKGARGPRAASARSATVPPVRHRQLFGGGRDAAHGAQGLRIR